MNSDVLLQSQLFFVCESPPRPKKSDDNVVEIVADKLMPHVIKWMQDADDAFMTGDACGDDEYIKNVRQDIISVISHKIMGLCDGYMICKELDEFHHWLVNSDLVEIMDKVYQIVHETYDNLCAEWITKNNIIPKFKIGDQVKFEDRKGTQRVGKIINVYMNSGKYTIFCGELGHVCSGIGTHGVILNWEDVTQ